MNTYPPKIDLSAFIGFLIGFLALLVSEIRKFDWNPNSS